MAKQAPQKPHKTRTTVTTPKQALIKQLHNDQPHLKMTEIAAIAKTSHSYVIETLQRLGLRHANLKAYQESRADIWDLVSMSMLGSLTPDDIKKMPGAARVMAAGLSYDKMRIERGLSDAAAKPLVLIQIAGQNIIMDPKGRLETASNGNEKAEKGP